MPGFQRGALSVVKCEARIPAGGSPASQMPFTSWAFLIHWSPKQSPRVFVPWRHVTPTGSLHFCFCWPRGSQRPTALGGVWLCSRRGALPSLSLGFPELWGWQPVNRGVRGGGVVARVGQGSPAPLGTDAFAGHVTPRCLPCALGWRVILRRWAVPLGTDPRMD